MTGDEQPYDIKFMTDDNNLHGKFCLKKVITDNLLTKDFRFTLFILENLASDGSKHLLLHT